MGVKEIVVYSQPGCGPCFAVKGKLNRAQVSFMEIDVTQVPEKLEHVRSLGYQETPVVEVFTTTGSYHFGKTDLMPHLNHLIEIARR